MEGSESSGVNSAEDKTRIKIEHFPEVDVIINLDYPLKEEQEYVLSFSRQAFQSGRDVYDTIRAIDFLDDQNGKRRFYVKSKNNPHMHLDFLLDRTNEDFTEDPIEETHRSDFNRQARYAKIGILNEMLLAVKIRKLVSSEKFQDLAREYGFSSFSFSEPIVAFVNKNFESKYLVYKNVPIWDLSLAAKKNLLDLTDKLRAMFLEHSIMPSDLRWPQFIIEEKEGKLHLVLIDTEAYTERKPTS